MAETTIDRHQKQLVFNIPRLETDTPSCGCSACNFQLLGVQLHPRAGGFAGKALQHGAAGWARSVGHQHLPGEPAVISLLTDFTFLMLLL